MLSYELLNAALDQPIHITASIRQWAALVKALRHNSFGIDDDQLEASALVVAISRQLDKRAPDAVERAWPSKQR